MIAKSNFRRIPPVRVLVPEMVQEISANDGYLHTLAGKCMGTTWAVRLVSTERELFANLKTDIARILECVESQMSHFRDNSALRQFARLNPNEWMSLPDEFAHVLHAALEVACHSNGAFDPTIAPLINAWGFGEGKCFSEKGFIPLSDSVEVPHGGRWQEIRIDQENRIRQPGCLSLNLSGIAKGFAVDGVSEYLNHVGLSSHLVEIGGELRGSGMKPGAQPWWVEVEMPVVGCPLPKTRIALHNLAVATSGDYRRFYCIGDRKIHHTINPRTGAPVEHGLSSVTVIHEKCMFADAWATALMVLGPVAGLDLATAQGLFALLQWQDEFGCWKEAASENFQALQV
jgi:FAD:protein FMN transferase